MTNPVGYNGCYQSKIQLGERYLDEQTGYSGVATAICFFQHACERVTVESYDENRKLVIEQVFDAPRLVLIRDGKLVREPEAAVKPGGTRSQPARPGSLSR